MATKETFYFSHDYNARSDEKIKRLMAKHGLTGYGLFWAIIEDLYHNANALQLDFETIAFDLRADKATVESVIKDFGLFEVGDNTFSSGSVQRRLEERNARSEKARQSADKRWSKKSSDANALQTQTEGNAIKESKGNQSKGNEKKENSVIVPHANYLEHVSSEDHLNSVRTLTNSDFGNVKHYLDRFIKEKMKSTYPSAEDAKNHFLNCYRLFLKANERKFVH